MGTRTILHSDLNSFYASLEMMLDLSLRRKAVAVYGSTEDRHGIICTTDLLNEDEVWKVMLELSQDIGYGLHKLATTGVEISVRSNELGYRQFQAKLSISSRSPKVIAEKARELLRQKYEWHTPIRAVTVRAIGLIPEQEPQ